MARRERTDSRPKDAERGFTDACRERLATDWAVVLKSNLEFDAATQSLPPEIAIGIRESINSETLTYRYVLPTQILAKLVKPELFRAILAAIRERMAQVVLVYPVPNRVSIKQTIQVLERYLSARTHGIRMQAAAAALFRTIGDRHKLFADIRSVNVNASDAST